MTIAREFAEAHAHKSWAKRWLRQQRFVAHSIDTSMPPRLERAIAKRERRFVRGALTSSIKEANP